MQCSRRRTQRRCTEQRYPQEARARGQEDVRGGRRAPCPHLCRRPVSTLSFYCVACSTRADKRHTGRMAAGGGTARVRSAR